jgi:outer membrane biosynthesis protein TonB
MTAFSPRRRDTLAPAMIAAAALHLSVFVLAVIFGRPNLGPMGTAVPITLVSRGPTTDSRPAEAAPQTQSAQTESPTPVAKAPSPPPEPAPAPAAPRTPPAAAVRPAPPQKPMPDRTAPKAAPAKPSSADAFSLDRLAADVARLKRTAPARPGAAARAPARPETAAETRVDAGQGVSQSDIAGLSQLLERLWNPNCAAAGGDSVVVPVRFTVGWDGHVIGRVADGARESAGNPVVAAAARRAIDAVHQAEPYGPAYRGQTFTVNFDAKTACATR